VVLVISDELNGSRIANYWMCYAW